MQPSLSRHRDKNSGNQGHHQHRRKSRQHVVEVVTGAGQLEIEPVTNVADLKEQKEGPDLARILVVEGGKVVVRERFVGQDRRGHEKQQH